MVLLSVPCKLRPLWLKWFLSSYAPINNLKPPSSKHIPPYDIDRPYLTVAKLHFGGYTQSYSLPFSNVYPCRVACEPQMHFWLSLLSWSLRRMTLQTRAKKNRCSCTLCCREVNNKLIKKYMFCMFYILFLAYFCEKKSNNFLISGIMVSYWSFKYWSKLYRNDYQSVANYEIMQCTCSS